MTQNSRVCSSPNCYRPVLCKGFCSGHYTRFRRYEETNSPIGRPRKDQRPPCSVLGCNKISHARGLCMLHYGRMWRGQPLTEPKYKHWKSADYGRDIRLKVIAKLGSRCVRCGFKDERALQVDHIYGGGRQHLKIIRHLDFMKAILQGRFSEDVQLLCANCNWIKRSENRETRR
jgi:hypothetical protein